LGFNGTLEPYRPQARSPYRNVWFEREDDDFVAPSRARRIRQKHDAVSDRRALVRTATGGCSWRWRRESRREPRARVHRADRCADESERGGQQRTGICDKPVPTVAEISQDCRIGAMRRRRSRRNL